MGNTPFAKTRRATLGLLMTRPQGSFHLRQIVRLTGAGTGPGRERACLVSKQWMEAEHPAPAPADDP